ncbi:hypothetical protein D3C80_1394270 [compost metagenome]
MISCISYCAFSLLHLALNSNMLSAGVSSINSGASVKPPILLCSCCHSHSCRLPFLIFSCSISASPEIKRFTSCTEDISKENTTAGRWNCTLAFLAQVNTKAVLPIAGRAAIITKSEGCHPPVMRSRSVKPEGTPVNPSLLPRNSSSVANDCFTISSIFCVSLRRLFCAISNKPFSAWSKRSKISVVSS